MATVILPGSLARLFAGCPTQSAVDGATVAALLDVLDRQWPGMRDRLRDSSGAIRRHIQFFVDGERAGLDTELSDGSEVIVIPAISGG